MSALLPNTEGTNELKRALQAYKNGMQGRLYNEIFPDDDSYEKIQ